MRITVLKDEKISQKDYEQFCTDFTNHYIRFAGITPEYYTETQAYQDYPTELDGDGDVRPSKRFVKDLTTFVTNKYRADGTDHVWLLIDESNWKSGKIWGTNYSGVYGTYHVQYMRFDNNLANSFGTANHECFHCFDALIFTETGVDINSIVKQWLRDNFKNNDKIQDYLDINVFNWDRDVVHGALKPPFKYMRWIDNTDVLTLIAPHLRLAYNKRKARHHQVIYGMMQTIVALASEYLRLLRARLTKKDGVTNSL